MQVRQALREQHPSLALQRAAMDEIARLDDYVRKLENAIEKRDKIISDYSWAESARLGQLQGMN